WRRLRWASARRRIGSNVEDILPHAPRRCWHGLVIGGNSSTMITQRPFRFGVVAAAARSADEWLAKARRVESLGYSTLVMPDTLRYTLSPFPALAAAAAATRTLRVGTYVLDNDFRHPVLLAKEAASLDLVSGGRHE